LLFGDPIVLRCSTCGVLRVCGAYCDTVVERCREFACCCGAIRLRVGDCGAVVVGSAWLPVPFGVVVMRVGVRAVDCPTWGAVVELEGEVVCGRSHRLTWLPCRLIVVLPEVVVLFGCVVTRDGQFRCAVDPLAFSRVATVPFPAVPRLMVLAEVVWRRTSEVLVSIPVVGVVFESVGLSRLGRVLATVLFPESREIAGVGRSQFLELEATTVSDLGAGAGRVVTRLSARLLPGVVLDRPWPGFSPMPGERLPLAPSSTFGRYTVSVRPSRARLSPRRPRPYPGVSRRETLCTGLPVAAAILSGAGPCPLTRSRPPSKRCDATE